MGEGRSASVVLREVLDLGFQRLAVAAFDLFHELATGIKDAPSGRKRFCVTQFLATLARLRKCVAVVCRLLEIDHDVVATGRAFRGLNQCLRSRESFFLVRQIGVFRFFVEAFVNTRLNIFDVRRYASGNPILR